MRFARETLHAIHDEKFLNLLYSHYREIAHFQDIELKPDWQRYYKLEELGSIRIYTARNDADELIGYAIYFVGKNAHYRDSLQANQDILFLRKDYRGAGGRLIKFADAELAREGVQAVYQHVKAAHNFGPLLERMNYKLVDYIYVKRLDGEKK